MQSRAVPWWWGADGGPDRRCMSDRALCLRTDAFVAVGNRPVALRASRFGPVVCHDRAG